MWGGISPEIDDKFLSFLGTEVQEVIFSRVHCHSPSSLGWSLDGFTHSTRPPIESSAKAGSMSVLFYSRVTFVLHFVPHVTHSLNNLPLNLPLTPTTESTTDPQTQLEPHLLVMSSNVINNSYFCWENVLVFHCYYDSRGWKTWHPVHCPKPLVYIIIIIIINMYRNASSEWPTCHNLHWSCPWV